MPLTCSGNPAANALMRPTFWILCLALLVAWTYGLLRGFFKGGWKLYAVCLGMLVLLCLGFWAIDPRTSAFHPFSGGYEAELLEAVQDGKAPQMDGDTAQEPMRARVGSTSRVSSSSVPTRQLSPACSCRVSPVPPP
jgi:hypothetical protein